MMGSRENIEAFLGKNNLITDGAFGTYYAEKYHTQEMPELANLLYPARVREIHGEYVRAGAGLIRTNTFASNTAALQTSWENVEKNIRAAVEAARAVAEPEARNILIAGDIGPVSRMDGMEPEEEQQEYERIVEVFADCGIEILDFETFSELESILPAVRRAKEKYGMYIMTSFSVNQYGYSTVGRSAKQLLLAAGEEPCIDAAGLNCGMGPGHMQSVYGQLALPENVSLMALPNAGYATLSRNRIRYSGAPPYFTEKMAQLAALGVQILGGCCGTDPDYIRQMAACAEITKKRPSHVFSGAKKEKESAVRRGFLYDEAGERKKKKLIAVELAPPFDANDEKLLESARRLKDARVDVLTFPDSPSGRTRVDSVLMAEKVQRVTGMEVMPHICCRDKNGLAIRSLLMGAKVNEIHNFLMITGDPLPTMARQSVKAVFNFDAVGMMKLAQEMNGELFAQAPLCYGGAVNQGRRNMEVEQRRVEKKMDAGAEFFLTQPVFTEEDARRLRKLKKDTGACILCGIMPLISRRNALFMRNEIAGVNVTDEIVNRYPEHAAREEGEAVGLALAKELLAMVEDFADGYYFSFPFNRVYLLKQLLGEDKICR
ncbi:MAG: bifunctional homocysteine S-methyltransferase/methylenetetrahydrofolate reductase [Muribaculaceae bacterium]|nr:bifunctional homocysteine S-methyltransferase/methylenetetrahydrofolate reductase [Muribaculaceae bacterium]MCM1491698.1 bifunctional homocysteine S-methyltransferase/methylenetetrahydrofolate reductase [Muribaculaceae bacterium]